jgi:hypothetical protein
MHKQPLVGHIAAGDRFGLQLGCWFADANSDAILDVETIPNAHPDAVAGSRFDGPAIPNAHENTSTGCPERLETA